MIDIRTALELLVIALREWRRLPLLGVAGWAFGCWCILAPALAPAASVTANQPRNILILHSYHQGLPWTDSEQEGIVAGLGQHLPEFGIYIEYLDTLRFPLPGEKEQSEIVRRLAERYAKPGIDILVATDDPAYRLLLAHRDHFWPGKPLLFAGVNNIGPSDLAGFENVAGVSEAPDFPANLNLIQQFHPKTNRLVVIGDDTKTFASNRATLEAANAALPKPFAIEVVTHRLLKEVTRDLKALSGDFVVMLMGRPFDESGRIVPESESAAALRNSTTRPLYSAWSFFLDHGIVGGKLVSGTDQGMAVAALVLDLRAGKAFSDLPRLTASPNRYMFDYEELDRFGLTRQTLPSNSIVINRPQPVWDAYPRTFVGAVALMVFLLVLLTFQARNLRVKRQLSAEVEKELILVQALMSAVPFPMFFKDVSLRYQRFNRAFSDFLSTSKESMAGPNTNPVAATPQAPLQRIKDEELLAAGGQQIYETKVASANGGARDIVFHKAVVRLPNGQLEGIVGAMLDVTELRKVERDVRELNLNLEQRVAERTAELQRQQIFTQAVLENVSDGVIACDQSGMLSFFNRAAREMHGIAQEDLPSERWAERYRLYRADGATPMTMEDIPLFRAFRGEMIRDEQMTLERADGRKLVVLAAGQAISDSAGTMIGAVVSLHDITEQKIAEIKLREAKDAAEAANQAKSAFLANMSHELRTPLNAILGFSALLQRDAGIVGHDREHLDIINRSGEHLLGLINDILDMAKIEAGRVQLEKSPFDLNTIVRDLVGMMGQRALEKSLELRLERSSRVVRYLRGDEIRLRQVLVNLLGNAIKFTRQGVVTLRLEAGPDPSEPRLRIEVEDTGPGIAPEDQARIFDAFVQANQTGQQGTGLGLAITRQLVELMGGRIGVTGRLGQGSCFWIDLPVEPAAASEVAGAVEESGEVLGLEPGQPDWRILIVEDQPENSLLLGRLLEDAGFQVRAAENGVRGVELFQRWRPHFIWMDRRMPVMDGLEATRRIRALPGGQEVKIAALTASVFAEQRGEMLAAGMDDILHKPFRPKEIFGCLGRHLDLRYLRRERAEPSDAGLSETPMDRVALAALPDGLRRALADALAILDTERIDALIGRVAERDAALGQTLRRHADDFDYAPIEEALRRESETGAAARLPD